MYRSEVVSCALLATVVTVVACGSPRSSQDVALSRAGAGAFARRESPPPTGSPVAALAGTDRPAMFEAKIASIQGVATAPASPAVAADAIQRVGRDSPVSSSMIIRNGSTSIEVDSLERAIALVRAIASRSGGFVANSSGQSGRDQLHSATLELKIPATRFDEVLSGLAPVGRAEGVNITTEDVGEEYVDVGARVANARKLEARLIELVANSTGRLSDVLAVERELARVREEIERFEGRLRYLRTRTATSSLAVTLHERLPIIAVAAHNPFAQAARDAWRNFVGMLAAGIALLGYVLPLGVLAAIAFVTRRRMRMRPAMQ